MDLCDVGEVVSEYLQYHLGMDHIQTDKVSLNWYHVQHRHWGLKGLFLPYTFLIFSEFTKENEIEDIEFKVGYVDNLLEHVSIKKEVLDIMGHKN